MPFNLINCILKEILSSIRLFSKILNNQNLKSSYIH